MVFAVTHGCISRAKAGRMRRGESHGGPQRRARQGAGPTAGAGRDDASRSGCAPPLRAARGVRAPGSAVAYNWGVRGPNWSIRRVRRHPPMPPAAGKSRSRRACPYGIVRPLLHALGSRLGSSGRVMWHVATTSGEERTTHVYCCRRAYDGYRQRRQGASRRLRQSAEAYSP